MTRRDDARPAELTKAQVQELIDGAGQASEAAASAMGAEYEIEQARRALDELQERFDDFDDRFDAFVRWIYDVYEWWRGEGGGPPVPASRGLSEEQIRRVVATMRGRLDRAPNQEEVAAELHTSESTLRRAMKDLGMEAWPPPPED